MNYYQCMPGEKENVGMYAIYLPFQVALCLTHTHRALTPECLLRTKELPAHFEALSSLGSLSNPASVPFQVRITLGRSVWLLQNQKAGLVRDLNPGPLAPEARIIPLDQRADAQN